MIPSMSSYPRNLITDWKSSSRNVRSNRPDNSRILTFALVLELWKWN